MIIAVASGKGGTGKTTVATNLAFVLHSEGMDVDYADCDVEGPNGHIFLRPHIARRIAVHMDLPQVDHEKCTGCGECGELCQFSAIVCIKEKVLTFPELCHACGGCALICPEKAITETPHNIGVVEIGDSGGIGFLHGKLNVGEAISPRIIAEIKKRIDPGKLTIIDAPPGTTCPVIEAVKETDHILLVAEPTPFGLNDLEIACDLVEILGIPCSLAINRCDIGDDRVRDFAESKGIPVVLEIPHDRRIAECYSSGKLVVDMLPEYRDIFLRAFENIAGAATWQKKSS